MATRTKTEKIRDCRECDYKEITKMNSFFADPMAELKCKKVDSVVRYIDSENEDIQRIPNWCPFLKKNRTLRLKFINTKMKFISNVNRD